MEQKNLEKQAEGPLSDAALDAVNGGLGMDSYFVYCPYCRFEDKVKPPVRCDISYEGKVYKAKKYVCRQNLAFYTVNDPGSGRTLYFNSEQVLIGYR